MLFSKALNCLAWLFYTQEVSMWVSYPYSVELTAACAVWWLVPLSEVNLFIAQGPLGACWGSSSRRAPSAAILNVRPSKTVTSVY